MPMVEIVKPANEALGDWFEALRGWLDRNGCGDVTFARVEHGRDRQVYRLAFRDAALSEKFSRTFAMYLNGTAEAEPDGASGFVAPGELGAAPA